MRFGAGGKAWIRGCDETRGSGKLRIIMKARIFTAFATCAMCLAPFSSASARAVINIVPGDEVGEGLFDASPVDPIGGNSGTTLGEQRRLLMQHAADAWGEVLDSAVPITIVVTMDPLPCDANNATTGSATATEVFHDFENAPQPDTAYPAALANRLAGRDLNPSLHEIRATFNASLNGDAACQNGRSWYYGFDNGANENQFDLKPIVMNVLAQALGVDAYINDDGSWEHGRPSVWGRLLFDTTTGKPLAAMTDAERATAADNGRRVVFTGENTTAAVPSALIGGTPLLRINAPGPGARQVQLGTADFGAALTPAGITGDLVYPIDLDATTTGCSFFGDEAAGKIVLIDRGGGCGFTDKARNAQEAGVLAVVIVNNQEGSEPLGMGGEDASVIITAVQVTRDEGTALKESVAAGTVNVTILADDSWRAGSDEQGRVYVLTGVSESVNFNYWENRIEPAPLLGLPSRARDFKGGPNAFAVATMRDLGWTPITPEGTADTGDDDDGCAAIANTGPWMGLLLLGLFGVRWRRKHR